MSAITKIKDFPFFDSQDARVKETILRRLTAVLEVKKVKHGNIKNTLVRIGQQNGVAWQTVHRWVKDYTAGGEAALIDERRALKGFHVPHQTVSWVRGLYHQHQRANDVCREVYRTVRTRYEKWLSTGDPQWPSPATTHHLHAHAPFRVIQKGSPTKPSPA
jgi:Winged helix-turn helix